MMKRRETKKGQVFTIDFILGLVGFIFLVLIAIKLIISIVPTDDFKMLNEENIYVNEMLMQEGYPDEWNTSEVIIPGITSDHRLNKTKLKEFDELRYQHTKGLFHITSEYVIQFYRNGTPLNITKCVHGYPIQTNSTCHPQFDTLTYSNFIKSERLLIYDSSIIRMVIYSWD